MISEPDTLARLVAYHDHIAVPPVEVADDVRRGRRRVRRNRGLLTAGVALAFAGVAVAASVLDGSRLADRPQPVAPLPTASPSGTTTTDWNGPLRPDASMSMVSGETPTEIDQYIFWTDGRDGAFGGIDIRKVIFEGYEGLAWRLELRETPPSAATLSSANRVIEYGLVVDANGDRVADCQIGISNASHRSAYRVSVKNLRTGVTDERVGPPYGYPIEFAHPGEARPDDPPSASRQMYFTFLSGRTLPCDPFGASAAFYAWATITDEGRVTAWDFAPDAAWLAMPS